MRRFVCCNLLPADGDAKLSWNIFAQADAETDEVYAQMTLQPLNPVSHRGLMVGSRCCASDDCGLCWVLMVSVVLICAARAERCIPAGGDGDHEQAAYELLLQDADGQRHQHAWRVLCAPSCSGARLPPSGVMSVYFGAVFLYFSCMDCWVCCCQ